MTLTDVGDVGYFIAAACLLPAGSYYEHFRMAGETLSITESVRKIESIRGGNMDVLYQSIENIKDDEAREGVPYPNQFWLQTERLTARNKTGEGLVPPIINELCPSLGALSVEQYSIRFWSRTSATRNFAAC